MGSSNSNNHHAGASARWTFAPRQRFSPKLEFDPSKFQSYTDPARGLDPAHKQLHKSLATYTAFENIVQMSKLKDIVEAREWLDSIVTKRAHMEASAIRVLSWCFETENPQANEAIRRFDDDARRSTRPLRDVVDKELRELAADPDLINERSKDMTYNDHVNKVLEDTYVSLCAGCDTLRDFQRQTAALSKTGGGQV